MFKCITNSRINKYPRLLLDTSILFKIISPELEEVGTKSFLNYIEPGIILNATAFSVVETITTAKLNWNRHKKPVWLTDDGYLIVINRLFNKISNNKVKIHNPNILDYFDEAVSIVHEHNIDFLDACFIIFMRRSNIFDLLVTADIGLYKAARANSINSWNVIEREFPEMA